MVRGTHLAGVRVRFHELLSTEEQATLAGIWDRLLHGAEHRGVALKDADDVHGAHGLLAEEQTDGPARRPVAQRTAGYHRLRVV